MLLVVINHFDERPADPLLALLAGMQTLPAGSEFDVCVVNNQSATGRPLPPLPNVRFQHLRENSGMNIGAWDYGWRQHPGYDYYLFLQDECVIKSPDWAAAFISRLQDPAVGLVGESFNHRWHQPWQNLQEKKQAIAAGHFIDGRPAARVDSYLDFMQRRQIDPGAKAGHLRALVWALRGDTLQAIDGFPLGSDYGECVASEIAVTKKVEALGLQAVQLADEPFHCIGHAEWARYTKASADSRQPGWKRRLRKALKLFQ